MRRSLRTSELSARPTAQKIIVRKGGLGNDKQTCVVILTEVQQLEVIDIVVPIEHLWRELGRRYNNNEYIL